MTVLRASWVGCLLALALTCASPAHAFWTALGAGAAAGVSATMPGGNQPAGSVSSQSVTVSWAQSSFLGSPLGTYSGGGYRLTRYAAGSSTPITPDASCATTISGGGATSQCVEAGVPYGSWQYSVTPVLNSFTGAASSKSATVGVATAAPVASTAIAQNPAAAQTTGDIQLTWATAGGATGYNVYRRPNGGAYDFGSPRNGATPIGSGTLTYADPGSGLAASTTYEYVVRAVAGAPAAESASSNQKSAATISRPAAPGTVTATPAAAARVDIAWSTVSGAVGYNVYRRTAAGSYNYASPLNGGSPLAALTYADLTGVNATSYFYSVRSVISGLGGAQVESASAESASATADSTPLLAPTAVSVTSGGAVLSVATCGVAAGTRYINSAGASAVGVSATIAPPESGETVVFSATSGATVASTVAAGSTTVTATLNLAALTDGTVTLTVRTKDLAGNLSTTARSPANVIIKDTLAPLTAVYSAVVILAPKVTGSAECGAFISVQKTSGGAPDTEWITSGITYNIGVGLLALGGTYDVTSTDLAGNVSAVIRTP